MTYVVEYQAGQELAVLGEQHPDLQEEIAGREVVGEEHVVLHVGLVADGKLRDLVGLQGRGGAGAGGEGERR